jgi:hypothetical protein
MKQVDLSIVLSRANRADAETVLAPNSCGQQWLGPVPDFAQQSAPLRRARFAARKALGRSGADGSRISAAEGDAHIVKVLYLAHATREKGLFVLWQV